MPAPADSAANLSSVPQPITAAEFRAMRRKTGIVERRLAELLEVDLDTLKSYSAQGVGVDDAEHVRDVMEAAMPSASARPASASAYQALLQHTGVPTQALGDELGVTVATARKWLSAGMPDDRLEQIRALVTPVGISAQDFTNRCAAIEANPVVLARKVGVIPNAIQRWCMIGVPQMLTAKVDDALAEMGETD